MKVLPTLLTLTFLALVPYSWAFPGSDGNPEHDAYAGQAGSVYDPATNPPRQIGTVTYNPDAVSMTNDPAIGTMAPGGTVDSVTH